MPVALKQEGAFGIGLQTEQGVFVAPSVWLPLMRCGEEPNSIKLRRNYVTLDMGDQNDFETRYFSAGEWTDGAVWVPLVPGSITALLSWMQDRNQDNQGKWASIVCDQVHTVAKLTDAKVSEAKIVLRQNAPAMLRLKFVALKHERGNAMAAHAPTPGPYMFRDATVEIATAGGALEVDTNIEGLDVTLCNMLEAPGKRHLYNLSGVRCRGRIMRDFVDTALLDDFMSGTETAMRVELVRGASVCVVSLPRVLYTESDLPLPDSNKEYMVESTDFIGLGSTDGLTAPIVLA